MPSLTTTTANHTDIFESGCFHYGTPLNGAIFTSQRKSFCCQGCLTVFELLTENRLADFCRFGNRASVRVSPGTSLAMRSSGVSLTG
jgi:hypothetical protein